MLARRDPRVAGEQAAAGSLSAEDGNWRPGQFEGQMDIGKEKRVDSANDSKKDEIEIKIGVQSIVTNSKIYS
jgi:hypothetical protein